MSILSTYTDDGPKHLGKHEYDFEYIDNELPKGYLNYIDKLFKGCEIKIGDLPTWDDSFSCQVVNGPSLVYGVQGNVSDNKCFAFFVSKIFLFNMIPMSYSQQTYFTKCLFNTHFKSLIEHEYEVLNSDIDIMNKEIVMRAALNY